MRVLLISYWFPPANTMAAIRIGKLAKFLHEAGHDVRILAARSPEDPSLAVEVPEERIVRTDYREVGRIFEPIACAVKNVTAALKSRLTAKSKPAWVQGIAPSVSHPPVVSGIRRHYYAMIQMPDNHIGWRRYALAAGRRLMTGWRPDAIVASAPPFTCLVIARRLSREFRVPWVAEFRDIWVDNPYNTDPVWRQCIDRLIERRILSNADAIVTVTPVWSAIVNRQYGHPVSTILNGFAEEDRVEPPPVVRSDTVSIVYTGAVYPGYRDPSPLFEAIALLGDRSKYVQVLFYGPSEDEVMLLAERHGVSNRVFVRAPVGHSASLKIQAAADVLLLMQWNNAKDEGNIPGKFFEYIGARRPILMLGYQNGILARMIRERCAGVVANTPHEIADHLSYWIVQRPTGIPALDRSVATGLSRSEQYRKYESLLTHLLDGSAPPYQGRSRRRRALRCAANAE